MARMWDLNDLVGVSEIAEHYGVGLPAVSNWQLRYPEFPYPLISPGNRPIYSMRQVKAWYESKGWKAGRHHTAD